MTQQSQNKHRPEPPKPPRFKPEFKLYPYQYIGIPLIFLIPILALLGVFGETLGEVTAASSDLAMHIEYPERFRYKMVNPIEVALTNQTNSVIEELRVRFDKKLIDAFSEVTFTPQVETITDEYYEVLLEDVQAGETRYVSVTVQGEHYYSHEGTISASADGVETVSETITSFVFP